MADEINDFHHCGHETDEELAAPHPCPYAEDIHNDSSDNCTCCESCQQECARDI